MNITLIVFLSFLAFLFPHDDDLFKEQGCHDRYENDGRHVTYDCVPVAGVDTETFLLLTHGSGYFAKDSSRVYCMGKPVGGVAPEDFMLLTYQYATDGRRIFNKCAPIAGASPQTFTVFPRSLKSGYAKDENNVYYDGRPISGAEPGSFVLYDFDYAQDDGNLYKNGVRIDLEEARQRGERVTFGKIFPYSKTVSTVFYKGRKLDGADPASFEELPGASSSFGVNVAHDKNTLWVDDVSHPFAGPGRQVGSPSGSDMPFWILGKTQLAYFNVDTGGTYVVNIADVNAGTLRMFPYAAYASDGDKVIHRGDVLERADAETFGVFSGVLGSFFSNGTAQFAYDKNHLYREEKTIFTFDGTARLLWPFIDDEGRSSDWSIAVALFGNEHSLWLVRHDRYDGTGNMTCVRMPVTPRDYRMISPIRNQPSDPVQALIGTDGRQVFYNDARLEGVDPAGIRTFETSYRRGVISNNALILAGYPILAARNTETGERHVVGKDGWRHVRFIDENGRPDRAEFFDGRIHVDIGRSIRIWEEGETPDESVWETAGQ